MPRNVVLRITGCCALLVFAGGCDRFQPPKSADAPTPAAAAEKSAAATTLTLSAPRVAEPQVIARVNQVPISLQEFLLRVNEQLLPFDTSWDKLPAADREAIGQGMLTDILGVVNTELMAQDSVARGALRDPELQTRVWYVVRSVLAQEWLQREQKSIRVTQSDVEAFYRNEQNKVFFKVPARIHVRQIAVRTDADAKQALRQLLDGADFAALAKSLSIAPNAATGGDVGWIVRAYDKELYGRLGQALDGEVLPYAEDVVFALDKGQASQVVKGPGVGGAAEAYYLFQVADKQPERVKALTEVQDQIRAGLASQKLKDRVDQLRAAAKVDVHQERLKEEASKGAPPAGGAAPPAKTP